MGDECYYNTYMNMNETEIAISAFGYDDSEMDVDLETEDFSVDNPYFDRSGAPSPSPANLDVDWTPPSLIKVESTVLAFSKELDSLTHKFYAATGQEVPLLYVIKHESINIKPYHQNKFSLERHTPFYVEDYSVPTADSASISNRNAYGSNNSIGEDHPTPLVTTPRYLYLLDECIVKPLYLSEHEGNKRSNELDGLLAIPYNDFPLLHTQQCASASDKEDSSSGFEHPVDFEPYDIDAPGWFDTIHDSAFGPCSATPKGSTLDGSELQPQADGFNNNDYTAIFSPNSSEVNAALLIKIEEHEDTSQYSSTPDSLSVNEEPVQLLKTEDSTPTFTSPASSSRLLDDLSNTINPKQVYPIETPVTIKKENGQASTYQSSVSHEQTSTQIFDKEDTISPGTTPATSVTFPTTSSTTTSYIERFDFEKFFKHQKDETTRIEASDAALILRELRRLATLVAVRSYRRFRQTNGVTKPVPKRKMRISLSIKLHDTSRE